MDLTFSKNLKYRPIEETKIETGNSVVYRAQDLEFNRTVCIKIIQLTEDKNQRKEEYKRAVNEINALVAVSELTTHVPMIHHVFYDEKKGLLYIIMQWINGQTLKDQTSSMSSRTFISYMIKLCDILTKLEMRRMSHKDIKPSNIMITKEQEVFLIDFNLTISTPNQREGTQHYKAPEMDANSKSMDRSKVDYFSIGVMMYEFFTKKLPERGVDYALKGRRRRAEKKTDVLQWDLFVEPIQVNPNLEPKINDIIVRCMKLDPKQRYNRASEFKADLIQAERKMRSGNKGTGSKGKI